MKNEQHAQTLEAMADEAYDITDTQVAALRAGAAALRAPQGWQPIETAPKNRIELLDRQAVGAWWHKNYGWMWGQLDYHADRHHKDGGYFIANHGEPTDWMWMPLPSPPLPPVSPVSHAEGETR